MARPNDILAHADHCPPPARPWLGRQSWKHMLLAHWELEPAVLQALLPPQLRIDSLGGSSWLSVVAYRMEDVRLRGMPAWMGLRFPQLNLRTYVRFNGRLGIYFFSLDASSRLAVAAGRRITGLPYFDARMHLQQRGRAYKFHSRRVGAPIGVTAAYEASPDIAASTELDQFLTERYAFYTATADGSLYCGAVCHAPWTVARVEATLSHNSLADGLPTLAPQLQRPADYMQYAPGVDVLFWRPVKVAGA